MEQCESVWGRWNSEGECWVECSEGVCGWSAVRECVGWSGVGKSVGAECSWEECEGRSADM